MMGRRVPGKWEMRITSVLIVACFFAVFVWLGATAYLIAVAF